MEIREFAAFSGELVDLRCLVALRAKAAHIGVAQVIHENDDDVRRSGGGERGNEREETEEDGAHGLTRTS